MIDVVLTAGAGMTAGAEASAGGAPVGDGGEPPFAAVLAGALAAGAAAPLAGQVTNQPVEGEPAVTASAGSAAPPLAAVPPAAATAPAPASAMAARGGQGEPDAAQLPEQALAGKAGSQAAHAAERARVVAALRSAVAVHAGGTATEQQGAVDATVGIPVDTAGQTTQARGQAQGHAQSQTAGEAQRALGTAPSAQPAEPAEPVNAAAARSAAEPAAGVAHGSVTTEAPVAGATPPPAAVAAAPSGRAAERAQQLAAQHPAPHEAVTPEASAPAPSEAAPVAEPARERVTALGRTVPRAPERADTVHSSAEVAPVAPLDAPRAAEHTGPVAASTLQRVLDAVDALEHAPPPRTVALEFSVDGGDDVVRLLVSLRGETVHVTGDGAGALPPDWGAELKAALAERGFAFAGSDERGQGGRPQRDPERSPAPRPAVARAGRGDDGALRL